MRRTISLAALVLLVGGLLVQIGCSKSDDTPTTPPPPCSINILTPTGGTSWLSGERPTFRWEKTGSSSIVKIELLKGAAFDTVLFASWTPTTNPASFPWTVSTMGQASGDDYAIRITAVEDAACSAIAGPLEIIKIDNCSIVFPYTVTDTIPDLTAGDSFTITWNAIDTTGKVSLHLYDSLSFNTPGDSVGVIAVDLDAASGSYDWSVDSFNRGSYDFFRFFIFDSALPDCRTFSVPFRMTDEVVCTMDVLGIAQDTVFNPGQTATLTFNANNNSGLVDLRLYAGNLPVPTGLIISGYDLSQGPFTWTVEDFGWNDDNSRYNIKAIDASDIYCSGESERFTITR